MVTKDERKNRWVLKGVGNLHSFWDYNTLRIGIGHWTLEGFEFRILVHVDGDLGIAQGREFLEFEDICRDTPLE